LGASTEDHVEAIQLQIVALQRRLIQVLEEEIANILQARIAELKARIDALLSGQE
jgi:hypothetical protein